jgi:V-type H+-transporting ATPase subunit a
MQIEKTVFIVFFAGDWSCIKITKICDAFGANRYNFPEDAREQRQMISEVLILGLIKNKLSDS